MEKPVTKWLVQWDMEDMGEGPYVNAIATHNTREAAIRYAHAVIEDIANDSSDYDAVPGTFDDLVAMDRIKEQNIEGNNLFYYEIILDDYDRLIVVPVSHFENYTTGDEE